MTGGSRDSRRALAAETWRRLFRLFISTRSQRDEVLGRHGLTPNDIRALTSLRTGTGRTMRSLAEEWGCDASNATWIVDRLEKRELATRTTPAADRRVKEVVLTAAGVRLRRQVLRDLDRPPREFLALEPAQLMALRDALRGLAEPAAGGARGASPQSPARRPSRTSPRSLRRRS